ncbi:centrosomal protein CEP250 [Microdochium nivale]|nr:centrosomal protein CEP250 [Microdochium nivale]
MLWTTSWLPTSAASTILVVCAILAWSYVDRSKSLYLNFLAAFASFVLFWTLNPELAAQTPITLYRHCLAAAIFLRLDFLLEYHANMLITGAAFVWLAHRAWQTLWKPVPELIGVLGVDVPDAPDVSLAGIRADAATLNWTRPRVNRPVSKFLIQVNGVNVGESANLETAITVTGLKPNHFYNVRVIAVGYNNFQAGSRVIRLRTFTRDGRPELGNGRLPSNFVPEEQQHAITVDTVDDDGVARNPAAGVETAVIPESPALPPRDITANASGAIGRRNTLTRKHSPSTASMEQFVRDALENGSTTSLQELGEKFQAIRREIEETQLQITKDEKENKELMDELTEEKKEKKRELKDKDDTTEKLKREVGSTDRAMRSAQQRKTQKEKVLRERQTDRKKLDDDIAKWEKDMASMAKRQATFDKEKIALQEKGDSRSEELRAEITALQASLAQEEQELRERGKELKDAEEQRKKLPGGEESEEFRESDRQIRRAWEMRARDLQRRLFASNKKSRMGMDYGNVLKQQLATAQNSGLTMMYDRPGVPDYDSNGAMPGHGDPTSHPMHNSHGTTANTVVPSPTANYAHADAPYHHSTASFGGGSRALPPGFVQGPLLDAAFDFSNSLDEEGFRALTAGAPLSPTAHSLLPAGMLDDLLDDDENDVFEDASYSPPQAPAWPQSISPDNDAYSPSSSPQAASLVSSPHGSSHHLPFPQFGADSSDHHSFKGLRGDLANHSSPGPPAAPLNGRRPFNLTWLNRAPKSGTNEPPALGSLKAGQSQSFPRQGEGDLPANKRRISFSTSWSMFNRNSVGPDMLDSSPRGLLQASRLGLGSNTNSGIFADRDPSSPRPVSIASQELVRPSTESGSIWGRPLPSRIWPQEDSFWSSRNPSRRPSIHGSPSALKTTLADADDEILLDAEILHASPSQVGVIGSRPSAKSLSQRLNPAAPSFMGAFFRPRGDRSESGKDAKDSKDKSKLKVKERDAARDKKLWESFASTSDAFRLSVDESPSDSRLSRDTLSVTTPSVSESRESLSLDHSFSNPPSDALREQDNTFKKLLRKGSSGKFSLSSVGRNFSSKKGPGSVSNSEKNTPLERMSFDENTEELGVLGRGYESLNSSPLIGGPSAAAKKDKGGGWGARFTIKKKPGKEKESLDLDRTDSAPISPGSEDK